MSKWLAFERSDHKDYINLDNATRIVHFEQHSVTIHFNTETVTINKLDNLTSYNQVLTYIGLTEPEYPPTED